MTPRLVTPETLAAALSHATDDNPLPNGTFLASGYYDDQHDYNDWCDWYEKAALVILAALPPDPRLDALLAAARAVARYPRGDRELYAWNRFRDALAAFEEEEPWRRQ